MKLSITITSELNRLIGHDFRRILDIACWAEEVGVHQLDLAEHLLMGDGKSYPFGDYPAPLDDPWPEPITTLAPIDRPADIGVTMVNLGLGWSVRDASDMQRTIDAMGQHFQQHL